MWSESKPPLKDPQLCAYIVTNPRAACGHSLGVKPHPDPEERSIKKIGTGG
jgi:hypothetical protein